jgi:hypothetical protein
MSVTILLSSLSSTLLFYTDPGSGALLLQIITATLLGGLFYFRKIKDRMFRKKLPEDEAPKLKSKKTQEAVEQ